MRVFRIWGVHLGSDDLTFPDISSDLSEFKPMRFELELKSASLNMRLPAALLDAVKARARARGIPYTRYVRLLLESDVVRNHQ